MIKGVGIDLGTTNSVLAYVDQDDRVVCVKNIEGKTLTPSAVIFTDGQFIVGENALSEAAVEQVASYFKPHIGNSNYICQLGNKTLSVVELSSLVLKKLKDDSEKSLGTPITSVVITVPAYFKAPHRDATVAAAQKAGLEVIKLINEPTAAALYYGLGKDSIDGYYLVYDLGGGTFDVSLIKIDHDSINIVASRGDYNLGGSNWREEIVSYIKDSVIHDLGIDISSDLGLISELIVEAEKAKNSLSTLSQVTISFWLNSNQHKYALSRETFEQMTSHLMNQTTNLIDILLTETGIDINQINKILLVGGSCRMPMVLNTLKKTYSTDIRTCSNLDEVVACGAALEAYRVTQPQATLGSSNKPSRLNLKSVNDRIGHSLGLIAADDKRTMWVNSILIPKDSSIPAQHTESFELETHQAMNTMDVYLTQGEDRKPYEQMVVARYQIKEIPNGPRNRQPVKITYSYNVSGIIEVSGSTADGRSQFKADRLAEIGDLSWLYESPASIQKVIPRSILISIDLSGSMAGDPLQKSQTAAIEFIDKLLSPSTQIGLIVFADRDKPQCALTNDKNLLYNKVNEWSREFDDNSVGGGNSGTPFNIAQEMLKNIDDERWLIVLSDGVWSYQDKAIQLAQSCHKQGIMVVGIGFGHADEKFLKNISNSSVGSCFTDLENLTTSFNNIAAEIASGKTSLITK